ncbi:MAG: hypothetical protein Q7S27_07535 [Nanoarchaeota archaeon]|nr:hypothetical protein [Nanoarchaeota archaeon]
MRIKLLTYLEEKNNLYLNSSVLLKTPHKKVVTKFILDTGSPETIINYTDALRLNIPLNNLTESKIIRVGSRKYHGYFYDRLSMTFITTDKKQIEEKMRIIIVRPTSFKDIEEIDMLPTLLGMNFLKEKGYKLFCDFSKDEAYLEK